MAVELAGQIGKIRPIGPADRWWVADQALQAGAGPAQVAVRSPIDHQLGCLDVVKGGDRAVADPKRLMNHLSAAGQAVGGCREARGEAGGAAGSL